MVKYITYIKRQLKHYLFVERNVIKYERNKK